jgi:hypothetical protein
MEERLLSSSLSRTPTEVLSNWKIGRHETLLSL